MIKIALNLLAASWILSPVVYIAARLLGLVNHPQDLMIILFLMVGSTITAFLTFGKEN